MRSSSDGKTQSKICKFLQCGRRGAGLSVPSGRQRRHEVRLRRPVCHRTRLRRLAALGERRGWDGVFAWEALYGVDAWVNSAAAAMVTERIRLGTLLTPRPATGPGTWPRGRLGRPVSGGRVVMSVGLGALHPGWLAFEADEGRAARARKLDESLAIYAGLLGGARASPSTGSSTRPGATTSCTPPPTPQRPHPPVWVVGAASEGPRRAAALPRAGRPVARRHPGDSRRRAVDAPKTVDDFAAVIDDVRRLRAEQGLSMEGYDVVIEADSHGDFTSLEPAEPAAWAAAGGDAGGSRAGGTCRRAARVWPKCAVASQRLRRRRADPGARPAEGPDGVALPSGA